MKKKFTVAAAAMLFAGAAYAQIIPAPEAMERALALTGGGTVNGLELVFAQGGPVYRLVVDNAAFRFHVTVNASTGEVLTLATAGAASGRVGGYIFMWPTASRFITSPYGWRTSPVTGRWQFHTGIDIRGAAGTPIWAAMDGRVTAAGWDNIFGNFVVIAHHSGFSTLYGHMSAIRVRNGDFVRAGQRIGDIGSTGVSTGPHLHFTVFRNGVTVNPVSVTRR